MTISHNPTCTDKDVVNIIFFKVSNKFVLLTFLYLFFIVYGSLVPLDYRPFPYDQAIAQFKNIRYLNLGIESRADWIANILLYIPLSFLFLGSLRSALKKGFFSKAIFSILVFGFCIATAVGVEFVQQFFPPRTVSLNDLIAETLGAILGMITWFWAGGKIIAYSRQLSIGNWLSIKSAIVLYLPIYVFLSLFPFDFVTSTSELNNKIAAGQDSFFIDIDGCRENLFRCSLKWLLEIAVLVPLGALFAALPYVPNRKSLAVVVGFLLGLVIEFTQLFIYTGSAQGFSIITRMLGMAVGVKAYDYFVGFDLKKLKPWLGWLIGCSSVLYLVALAAINGWMEGDWISVEAAQHKLNETRFLPFYYFYYTTETIALVSLLSNVGMYMPVGFLFWLFGLKNDDGKKVHGFWVGLTASTLAILVETGKLFLRAKHVDPTDVLIAFVAGVVTYSALSKLQRFQDGSNSSSVDARVIVRHDPIANQTPLSNSQGIQKKGLLPAGLIGILILYQLIHYPIKPILLALFVFTYCYALFRRPLIGLFVIPALLPVMDFTPWTGRFFLDEFDLVVLATIMISLIQPNRNTQHFPASLSVGHFFVGLFMFSLAVSLCIGLAPFPAIGANSFSNYYSHYNALRVAKGFLLALLLSPYLIHYLHFDSARRYFSSGVLLGLAGLTILSVLERWIFPGLIDYDTNYRINGLFSTMHTGGGHIVSYLALSMPFILILMLSNKHQLITKMAGILLFILGHYTLLMTFSRGGVIGIVGGFSVLLVGLYYYFTRQHRLIFGSTLIMVLVLSIPVVMLAVQVFEGDLMKSRVNVVKGDSAFRHKHWAAAIDMMDVDFVTRLFGMGLGSFPRTFYWSNQENAHPATYRIGEENGNRYLALQGGDALFMGQYISIQPNQRLKLTMDVRSPEENAILSVPICEKSLLYSFRCVSTEIIGDSKDWQRVEKEIDSANVGSASQDIAGGWLTRPVQLALFVGDEIGKIIEIDNLSLRNTKGENLIVNGDFSNGTDRWFFSTEKHYQWHIDNIWVHILFDMGWLGFCVFIFLLIYVYCHLFMSLKQDIYASILLSAFTGFLIVGYVESPFDAPRLSFLFFMLICFAVFGCKRPDRNLRVIRNT